MTCRKRDNCWYIDSGATKHMTFEKDLIVDFIEYKLYFKHEFKCFIAISNNEKTIETRGPPGPSVLLFSSCLSSQ